jgi:CspA family cold shock protein
MPITGTVARIILDKGFAFIQTNGDVEYFFHRSALIGAKFELLREGQAVIFDEGDNTKGPRAERVRIA